MLPSTAIPSAAPNSRVASFIAEPAPARLSGTADMIDAVIGAIDNDTPGHERGQRQPGVPERRVEAEPGEEARSPSATSSMPNATERLAPKR